MGEGICVLIGGVQLTCPLLNQPLGQEELLRIEVGLTPEGRLPQEGLVATFLQKSIHNN